MMFFIICMCSYFSLFLKKLGLEKAHAPLGCRYNEHNLRIRRIDHPSPPTPLVERRESPKTLSRDVAAAIFQR